MRSIVLLLSLLLAATPVARAQNTCVQHVKFPAVGRWAEYTALHNKKEPGTVRYAVVGSENRKGTDYKWLEVMMTGDKKDRTLTTQMLLPGNTQDLNQIQEIIFKAGDKQAMKMSGTMMMAMIRGQLDKGSLLSEICKNVTLVGEETVAVPAGTFKTMHFRSAEYQTDHWVSSEVPFSIVKSVGKDYEMALAAVGDGAKSSITETPLEMPGLTGP